MSAKIEPDNPLTIAKKIKAITEARIAHISATDPAADWESEYDMLRHYIGDLANQLIEALQSDGPRKNRST